jgi:hypothetical protein
MQLSTDNSEISTARGRDYCGKPLSQHLSFGATIKPLRGRKLSADSGAKTKLGFGKNTEPQR